MAYAPAGERGLKCFRWVVESPPHPQRMNEEDTTKERRGDARRSFVNI